MTLQDLQQQIYNGGVTNSYLIFLCEKPSKTAPMKTFLARQYINAIAKVKKLEINYIEDINVLFNKYEDIFSDGEEADYLNVYMTDELDCTNEHLFEQTNLIIVTSKIKDDAIKDGCKTNTITMPKLDNWQIKDYLYSMLKDVQKEKLDWLQDICHNDIDRLQVEIDRLLCFNEGERDKAFEELLTEGVYQDLSNITTFSLSNALTRRDIHSIKTYYPDVMRSKDFSDMGFLIIVLNAFKNFVLVKLHPNPTEESIGLKKNQIYAISKTATGFTSKQLINIYRFLSDMDRKIKTGEMWMDVLVDYIIVKIMTINIMENNIPKKESSQIAKPIASVPMVSPVVETKQEEDSDIVTKNTLYSLTENNFDEVTNGDGAMQRYIDIRQYLHIDATTFKDVLGYDTLALLTLNFEYLEKNYPNYFKNTLLAGSRPGADIRLNVAMEFNRAVGFMMETVFEKTVNTGINQNKLINYSIERSGIDKKASITTSTESNNDNIDFDFHTPSGIVPIEFTYTARLLEDKSIVLGETCFRRFENTKGKIVDKFKNCCDKQALIISVVLDKTWKTTKFSVIDTTKVDLEKDVEIREFNNRKNILVHFSPSDYKSYTADNVINELRAKLEARKKI